MTRTTSHTRHSVNSRFSMENLENRAMMAADVLPFDAPLAQTADQVPQVMVSTEVPATTNVAAMTARFKFRADVDTGIPRLVATNDFDASLPCGTDEGSGLSTERADSHTPHLAQPRVTIRPVRAEVGAASADTGLAGNAATHISVQVRKHVRDATIDTSMRQSHDIASLDQAFAEITSSSRDVSLGGPWYCGNP